MDVAKLNMSIDCDWREQVERTGDTQEHQLEAIVASNKSSIKELIIRKVQSVDLVPDKDRTPIV